MKIVNILLLSATITTGCAGVNDPETMKTTTAMTKPSIQQVAAESTNIAQNSASGRILAAGNHITGAIVGS